MAKACPVCGAALEHWALIDSTLVPYEPHPNGHLLLEQTPGGPARLFRPRRAMASQRRNDLSKFRATSDGVERFVSHYSVCNGLPTKPQESNHVR